MRPRSARAATSRIRALYTACGVAVVCAELLTSTSCASRRRWDEPSAAPAPRHGAVQRTAASASIGALVTEARALLARIRARELPGGVDRMVADLREASVAEGEGVRGIEATRLAADLLAARFRVSRERRDLMAADALLENVTRSAGAAACTALVTSGSLWQAAGDMPAARRRYLDYERRCPSGPELAHVHANLALLDPAVASAEAEAGRGVRNAHPPADAVGSLRLRPLRGTAVSRLRRVVIDPGHGGSDPGARGPHGVSESSINLDVARRLADHLSRSMGVDVVLTRDADEYVSLERRAERANEASADLFVSVHCNSSENAASHGVSTYVLDTTSDRVAARVAARENGAVESDPLADPEVFRILANLRLLGQGSRSMQLARSIQQQLLDDLGRNYPDVVDLGIHTARFHVLVGVRMPAVLVELSFISNPTEEARLMDPVFRDRVARSIAAALGSRP